MGELRTHSHVKSPCQRRLVRLEEGARHACKCGYPELPSDAVSEIFRSSKLAGACGFFL